MLSFRYCTGDAGGEDTYYITAYGIGGRYLQTFVVPSEDLPAEILEILKEHF